MLEGIEQASPLPKPLLTVEELCELLKMSRRSTELLRKRGMPYLRLSPGGHPRFDYDKVKKWMESNK